MIELGTAPAPQHSRDRTWVVALCFAAIVFDGYDLIVYGSAVPALLAKSDWSLTPAQVGDIGSYALLGMFAGALAAGPLADRIGRRRLLIASLTWFSTAMIFVAAAPSPSMLGLARFVAGLGFGGVVPTAIALTVEWAPPERRNLYNAVMLSGFPAGGVLAAVAALNLLEDHGFRLLFALGAVPLVTVVPLALRYLPESPAFEPTAPREPAEMRAGGLRTLLRGRPGVVAVVFAGANFCGMLLVYGLNTWLPQIMRAAGYPLGSALTFLLILNLGAIAGGLFGSTLADRFGCHRVAPAAFLASSGSVALLGSELPTAVLYVLVGCVGAAGVGSQVLLFGYVATHFSPDVRGSALGFTSGIGRLGAMCGPILGGRLVAWELGPAWNFAAFAAVALAGAAFTRTVPQVRLEPAAGVQARAGA